MITKIYKIENLLTIKVDASEQEFKNIANYFPNILEIKEYHDCDYQIFYYKINEIPTMYRIENKNSKLISPFRNSKYFVKQMDETLIAYSQKQEFSDEHVVIRENRNIMILAKNDQNSKVLIRLIVELIVRKLLENNYFPLHASCVVINNEAVLYFGDKGCGKSTALFSSVLITQAHPLANDITFVGKENNIWKTFGTPYDLTFDKSLSKELIQNGISLMGHNYAKQFSSDKIRYNPSEFCDVFNTAWMWSAPIKNINIVNLVPNKEFKENVQISYQDALKYLIKYGKDQNFFFDDLLKINELYPNYNYKRLSKEIIFNEIEGNILRYHKKKTK